MRKESATRIASAVRMRILIFHGYLLRGTGSNIYNANLARALARLGHEVHLLCQDQAAAELPWVDAVGRWEGGKLAMERVHEPAGEGSVSIYLPEIDGLLPVYVRDRYAGFRVKTFSELSRSELDRYLEANVGATSEVADRIGGADAALANHLVMGPLVLAGAGLRFAAKIHGSALEYTVKPDPRFLPPAREGMAAAAGVLVGSRHTAESLWETIADPALPPKTRLGPPGVDTADFSLRGPGATGPGLERLARRIAAGEGGGSFGRELESAAAALRQTAGADGPLVVYVGKLIVSKGVDLLLAAWPLVRAAHANARLLITGFGEYEDGLRRLLGALDRGALAEAREVAAAGWALEGGPGGALSILGDFLADPPPGYAEAGRGVAASVAFAGRLEHDEVAELLPAADALVMPSTFPESFGMVAAEAAACGVLPISADHSGMREVSRQLAAVLPPEVGRLTSFPIAAGAVEALAERLVEWLGTEPQRRREVGELLARRVDELWSWEGVARGVIDASAGRLESLPAVPESG
jgi:glycosyltransferase involved in cell wall biosynthesis